MDTELLGQMTGAVCRAAGSPGGTIGVAFSGGVDSALIALVCKRAGYRTELLTAGFAGSHDIAFAKKIAQDMGMPHHVCVINPAGFADAASRVRRIIGSRSMSWHENCIAFSYVAGLASSHGIKTVLTANGIDELFCGYDTYREAAAAGPGEIERMMGKRIFNELELIKAVSQCTEDTGARIAQPLLSGQFITYARSLPIKEKILGPDDMLRKHAVRRLAEDLGVPKESAYKRKKALQYGTLIHKALLRA